MIFAADRLHGQVVEDFEIRQQTHGATLKVKVKR
jgi:hypothetical protein